MPSSHGRPQVIDPVRTLRKTIWMSPDEKTRSIFCSGHFRYSDRKLLAVYFLANGVSPSLIKEGLRHGLRDDAAVRHLASLVGDDDNEPNGDVMKWDRATAYVGHQHGWFSASGLCWTSKRHLFIPTPDGNGTICLCHTCEATRYAQYC